MKKTILAIMLCTITIGLFAQRHEMRNENGERFAEELNLSQEQKEEIKAIRQNHRGEVQAIKTSDVSKEEKIAARNALHGKIREEMSQVLSNEQLSKWDAIHEERKTRSKEARAHRGEALERLQLTEEQQQELHQLRNDKRAQLDQIKASDLTREEKMAKAETVRNEAQMQAKSILSPEQFKIWNDLKAKNQHKAKRKLK